MTCEQFREEGCDVAEAAAAVGVHDEREGRITGDGGVHERDRGGEGDPRDELVHRRLALGSGIHRVPDIGHQRPIPLPIAELHGPPADGIGPRLIGRRQPRELRLRHRLRSEVGSGRLPVVGPHRLVVVGGARSPGERDARDNRCQHPPADRSVPHIDLSRRRTCGSLGGHRRSQVCYRQVSRSDGGGSRSAAPCRARSAAARPRPAGRSRSVRRVAAGAHAGGGRRHRIPSPASPRAARPPRRDGPGEPARGAGSPPA